MYKLNLIDKISFILVIIGAINWALVGLFNLDLVSVIFGSPIPMLGRIVYIIIGAAGINMIYFIIKTRKNKL